MEKDYLVLKNTPESLRSSINFVRRQSKLVDASYDSWWKLQDKASTLDDGLFVLSPLEGDNVERSQWLEKGRFVFYISKVTRNKLYEIDSVWHFTKKSKGELHFKLTHYETETIRNLKTVRIAEKDRRLVLYQG
jgi:hypothetical protein